MKNWNKPAMSYEEVYKKAKTFTGKNKDMDDRLKIAANITWDKIGSDILQSCAECGEKQELKRSHVIEIVCDADHMLIHGEDNEVYAYFIYLRDNFPTYRNKLMKEAFPYKTYGW